ncbi:hypothetical protein ACVCNH_09540 [Achromobacter anxifer]
MNIQSGFSVLSFQGADRAGFSKLGSTTTKSMSVDVAGFQKVFQGFNSSTTQAGISDVARKRSSQEGAATQGRTASQEKLLNSAASDPKYAEQLAYDMANIPSTICYDIRDQLAPGRGGEPLNKLSSGRIIDEAFKENFSKEAALIDAQRKAIYDSEKAKGTPADQILAKLFDHTNSQSKDYLEASGWLASVGGKTA